MDIILLFHGFLHPSRPMTCALPHQDRWSGQEKQHTWSLVTSLAHIIITFSLLLTKFILCQVMLFLFLYFLWHKTHTVCFSSKVKSPWGTHWVSPSFHVICQVHPDPWVKTISPMYLPFPMGGESTLTSPATFLCVVQGPYLLPQCLWGQFGQDQCS